MLKPTHKYRTCRRSHLTTKSCVKSLMVSDSDVECPSSGVDLLYMELIIVKPARG